MVRQGMLTSFRVSYTATKVAMLMTPSSVGSSPRKIRDLHKVQVCSLMQNLSSGRASIDCVLAQAVPKKVADMHIKLRW